MPEPGKILEVLVLVLVLEGLVLVYVLVLELVHVLDDLILKI